MIHDFSEVHRPNLKTVGPVLDVAWNILFTKS